MSTQTEFESIMERNEQVAITAAAERDQAIERMKIEILNGQDATELNQLLLDHCEELDKAPSELGRVLGDEEFRGCSSRSTNNLYDELIIQAARYRNSRPIANVFDEAIEKEAKRLIDNAPHQPNDPEQ